MIIAYFQLSGSFNFLKKSIKLFYMGKKVYKFDKVLSRKFGQKIAELRMNTEISQEELAFRANISPSYMSAIERGITDSTISTAKRLAKALQVELFELFKYK